MWMGSFLSVRFVFFVILGLFEVNLNFFQVMKSKLMGHMKTTVDENGKFDYIRADTNPVPPGWYDLDRSKHAVSREWYATAGAGTK